MVAKCGLRVEGYSRLSGEEFASRGSEPQLRHASGQRIAGVEEGVPELTVPAVRTIHSNKEAPSPIDRKRVRHRV